MATVYLRKKDDPYVYIANSTLLERNDLFPCNIDGTFLATNKDNMDAIDSEFEKTKEDLYTRAESLLIKNYKRLKLTTLIGKIIEAEINLKLSEKKS